jgi:drug/metabolite transporter (DMT)-like permease
LSGDLSGVFLIAAACACWALDNNLTQRLSLRDPFAIVRIKTLIAGLVNSTIGLAMLGNRHFPFASLLGALSLGCVSYGVSVVLDAYALRLVGAAREAAYFATAPFLGGLLAVTLLGEEMRLADLCAMAVMGVGVVLLLRERHSHVHRHEPLEHEHLHTHDTHHEHEHESGDPSGEPHSHRHKHAPLEHEHPHASDLHHRHRH